MICIVILKHIICNSGSNYNIANFFHFECYFIVKISIVVVVSIGKMLNITIYYKTICSHMAVIDLPKIN